MVWIFEETLALLRAPVLAPGVGARLLSWQVDCDCFASKFGRLGREQLLAGVTGSRSGGLTAALRRSYTSPRHQCWSGEELLC
jgi:hypothetical protein